MTKGISETELRLLMRLLHGELPASQENRYRRRLEAEPELEATFLQLRGAWEGLRLPPPSPVPAAFEADVLERLATANSGGAELSWTLVPSWARAVAAAALVVGAALGFSLSYWVPLGETPEIAVLDGELSLTDQYWQALGESPSAGLEDGVDP